MSEFDPVAMDAPAGERNLLDSLDDETDGAGSGPGEAAPSWAMEDEPAQAAAPAADLNTMSPDDDTLGTPGNPFAAFGGGSAAAPTAPSPSGLVEINLENSTSGEAGPAPAASAPAKAAPTSTRAAASATSEAKIHTAAPVSAGVVIKGKASPESARRKPTLLGKAEQLFWETKQRMQERFKKDKTGLITEDSELHKFLQQCEEISSNTTKLQKLVTQYQKETEQLDEAELELSRFLQENGVRDLSVVGEVMRSMAGAQKGLVKERQSKLEPVLGMFLSDLTTYCSRILEDTQATRARMERARLHYDAQRTWQRELENEKKKRPDKLEQVAASLAEAEKEYEALREDVITKILLLNDNRLQTMHTNLRRYHTAYYEYLTQCTELLKEAEIKQKTVVGDDAGAVLGD